MSLALLAPPAEEPLTLADAKAFAKIETPDDDMLVQALILSARMHVEAATRRLLVTQSWRLGLDTAREGRILVPVAPVQSVAAIRRIDASGVASVVDPSTYTADIASVPSVIRLAAAAEGRIEVDLVLGYGPASAVPEPLRHALRLLVAAWYEDRGGLAMTGEGAALPVTVEALIAPYRVRSL
jgi:uncharacterized phiE125 gp8 family phage protein